MTSNINILIAIVVLGLVIIGFVLVLRGKKVAKPSQVIEYDNDQVYVGNLPYTVDEHSLQQCFGKFGTIESIKVVKNHKTGRSKGYAFITYASVKEAICALHAHGKDMQGRNMVVRIAKPR